jgi:hypothetical protein
MTNGLNMTPKDVERINFLKSKLDEFMDEITAEPTVVLGLFLDGLAQRLAQTAQSEHNLKISVALTHKLMITLSAQYYAQRAKES